MCRDRGCRASGGFPPKGITREGGRARSRPPGYASAPLQLGGDAVHTGERTQHEAHHFRTSNYGTNCCPAVAPAPPPAGRPLFFSSFFCLPWVIKWVFYLCRHCLFVCLLLPCCLASSFSEYINIHHASTRTCVYFYAHMIWMWGMNPDFVFLTSEWCTRKFVNTMHARN